MRKIIFALFVCLNFSMIVKSQTVNNVPIKDLDVEYIQIVGRQKFLSSKVNVEIDFGQDAPLFGSARHTIIKDKDGIKMVFNSMVLALNFMTKYGYEFVQAYTTHGEDSSTVYYLMRKRRNGDEN